MRIFDRNWMQIEKYLETDDRIVLPVGSTEQHGYLSLGTDAILAERARKAARIAAGLPDFDLVTEQYWVLSDEYNDVLATTTQTVRPWDAWNRPVTAPAIWTRQWGKGALQT